MRALYNAALAPLRPAAALWGAVSPRRAEWSERRARTLPRVPPGGLWIHGASVGEAAIVATLAAAVRRRRPDLPLSVSALTPSGRAALPAPPAVDASFFAPLDFPGYPERVLRAVRPAALVPVETELWPNLLHAASALGIPVVLANARLAPERMARYRRWRSLYRPLAAGLRAAGAQSEGDARRLQAIGVRPEALAVTGNVKFDLAVPGVDPAALRRELAIPAGAPVLVAGSTRPGEEGPVCEAFLAARAAAPSALLVLAPRHPERAGEAEEEAARHGLALGRLSSGAAGRDGLLVDRVGSLGALYALAAAAFVGGTLVPVGGHNVLEPAARGVPVLFGPHTAHVEEPARMLLESGGAIRVADGPALGRAWAGFLRDPGLASETGAAAREVVERNRGALDRTVDLVLAAAEGR